LLTPWKRLIFEKITAAELVKKFSVSYKISFFLAELLVGYLTTFFSVRIIVPIIG
jgi:hypothetical protein